MLPPEKSFQLLLISGAFVTGLLIGGITVSLSRSPEQKSTALQSASLHKSNSDKTDFGAVSTSSKREGRNIVAEFQTALKLKDLDEKEKLIRSLIPTMNPSQIRAALDALQKDPYGDLSLDLLEQWAKSDPQSAVAYARKLNGWNQTEGVTSALTGWAQRDMEAALSWTEALPNGPIKSAALSGVIEQLSISDPQRAAELAASQTGSLANELLAHTLSKWAQKDLAGATAYVTGLPEGSLKTSAIFSMALAISSDDPAAAVTLINQMPVSDEQNSALSRLGMNLYNNDPKLALNWANQQSDPGIRANILSGIIEEMRVNDSQGAISLAQSMPDGHTKSQTINQILEEYARSDLQGAVTWAKSQPDPKMGATAWPILIQNMAESDPRGALTLAQSIPDQQIRNNSIVRMTSDLFRDDPQTAMQMTASIPDPVAQTDQQQSFAAQWLTIDPAAATQWINNSALPQAIKARLLKQK
jgi:hypothetical protein